MLLCFQLMRNVLFTWNMDKFNFLSQGQLESLNLDTIFLPLFKILPCYEVFFIGNLIFAIIARMLWGNHLNIIILFLFLTSAQNTDTAGWPLIHTFLSKKVQKMSPARVRVWHPIHPQKMLTLVHQMMCSWVFQRTNVD